MKDLKVIEGSMMYLVIGMLFVSVSIALSNLNTAIETQLIVTQYLIIGSPPILYLLLKKKSLGGILRLKGLSVKSIFMIILITLLVYPIAVLLNTLIMLFLSLLGSMDIPQIPTATTSQQYILYLFIIAISAGICEEVLFRGFIMRSFEKVSYKFAIVFSALLFGIFHFNIYNLGATIFFGIIFGYLVVLTGSLWAGIIGHITNNALAVSLGFLMNQVQQYSEGLLPEGSEVGTAEVISTEEILMAIGIFGFIALGTGFAALILLKHLRKHHQNQDPLLLGNNTGVSLSRAADLENQNPEENNYQLKEFLPVLPIFILFMVLTGFQLHQVLTAVGL